MLFPNHMYIFRTGQNTYQVYKKDPAKIVGGVAFTRYPVSIYALLEVDPKFD